MNENKIIKLSDGRTLGYAEYGTPKGKPVFYFHGWPGSRLSARKTDDIAKKLHIRIIAPDRPGYGLSTFKQNRTILEWPEDVMELVNHLQINKFSIVGVSGGGPYAAVTAYKISRKVTKMGIVVGLGPSFGEGAFDGIAFINKIAWELYPKIPFLAELSAILTMIEARYLPSVLFGFRSPADRKLLNPFIRNGIHTTSKEAFNQGFKGPALDLKLYTHDWGFNLKEIKTPTYLWYGDADRNVSLNMGKYYAKQIINSQLTIYPNEGHLLQITHAEEIIKSF